MVGMRDPAVMIAGHLQPTRALETGEQRQHQDVNVKLAQVAATAAGLL